MARDVALARSSQWRRPPAPLKLSDLETVNSEYQSLQQHNTMSQKRKHVDTPEDASSAPKPFKKHRAFQPGQGYQKPKNNKRPNLSHDDDNGRSANALKSRIRDLKRLLAHIDNVPKHKMSAGARQERERELEACEHELAEKQSSSREAEYRKKMIGKYHQVRFFGTSPCIAGASVHVGCG
jgi:hypothetical protein